MEQTCLSETASQSYRENLVLENEPLTGRVADKMLRNLKKMPSKGVYSGDARPKNCKGGHLVDLSRARTTPYFYFDIRGPNQIRRMKNTDLYW